VIIAKSLARRAGPGWDGLRAIWRYRSRSANLGPAPVGAACSGTP